MRYDPARTRGAVPVALLLDTDDNLRRAGRIVCELCDPAAGPGATPEYRRAHAAVDAVLKDVASSAPVARCAEGRATTLHRAARALDDLDVRIAGLGVANP